MRSSDGCATAAVSSTSAQARRGGSPRSTPRNADRPSRPRPAIAMVKLGKTYGNLMIDVHASNEKLRARARGAVALATGAGSDEVDAAIAAAGGDAKVALVGLATGVDARAARERLAAAGGVVREALRDA